jgi:hypothetical protein
MDPNELVEAVLTAMMARDVAGGTVKADAAGAQLAAHKAAARGLLVSPEAKADAAAADLAASRERMLKRGAEAWREGTGR